MSRESKIKVSEPQHGIRVLYASENSKDWLVLHLGYHYLTYGFLASIYSKNSKNWYL